MNASKVRIYDLAKELKLDTKRLIEEIRREGVDVSVPSNSVSKELAEKIRLKYFPKKEAVVKRAVKVVKRAARPAAEEEAAPEAVELPVAEPEVEAPEVEAAPEEEPTPAPIPKPATTARLVKKLTPASRAEQPAAAPVAEPEQFEDADVELPIVGTPEVAHSEPAATATARQTVAPTVTAAPPSRQIRVLRPTAAALDAGIRPGERAPAPTPPPAPPTPRERDERRRERAPAGRTEYRGTPGETATPQTTYIPPPDSGRRRSRRASPRGGRKAGEKGGRFDRGDFIPPPKALSLEDRIAGRMETPTPGELKSVRVIEGSTVKEFAEKLGIKPK